MTKVEILRELREMIHELRSFSEFDARRWNHMYLWYPNHLRKVEALQKCIEHLERQTQGEYIGGLLEDPRVQNLSLDDEVDRQKLLEYFFCREEK